MMAVRRAGMGASYQPFRADVIPWHAAMAATYAHATAPLRRLADRYVVRAALAIANGQAVPETVRDAFEKLPAVMAKAEARDGQIERAVIDLAEYQPCRVAQLCWSRPVDQPSWPAGSESNTPPKRRAREDGYGRERQRVAGAHAEQHGLGRLPRGRQDRRTVR